MAEVTLAEHNMGMRLLEIVVQIERERSKLPHVGKCACRGIGDGLCAWHVTVDNDLLEASKWLKCAALHLVAESG